jgi:V/A-type H+-transporting ATPase subunit I
MLTDAALLVLYVSALAAVAFPPALAATGVAALWYLLGAGLTSTGPFPRAIAFGAGRLLQGSLELGLNTLSFARVGAFALAHAGLSAAVLEIARGIDNPVLYGAVLIIGHAVAVAIETLIVFVQTTRLVLFEFFLRFLRAEGRILKPMLGSGEGGGDRPGT